MTRQEKENMKRMIRAAAAISKNLGQQVEGLVRRGQASPEELDRVNEELRKHLTDETAGLVYTTLLYALGLPKEKEEDRA